MNTLLTSSIPVVLAFIAVASATLAAQAVIPAESNETNLALIDLAGKALPVLATIAIAWIGWKQTKLLSSIKTLTEELAAVKTQGEQTHALVNGMATAPLNTVAAQAHRLAGITKDQGDIDAAVAADTAVIEHDKAEAVAKAIAASAPKKEEKL